MAGKKQNTCCLLFAGRSRLSPTVHSCAGLTQSIKTATVASRKGKLRSGSTGNSS